MEAADHLRGGRLVALLLAFGTALWAVSGYRGSDDPQALGVLAAAASLVLMTVALRPVGSPARRRAAFHGCIFYVVLMAGATLLASGGSPSDAPVLAGFAGAGLLLAMRMAGRRGLRPHRGAART